MLMVRVTAGYLVYPGDYILIRRHIYLIRHIFIYHKQIFFIRDNYSLGNIFIGLLSNASSTQPNMFKKMNQIVKLSLT